MICIKIFVIIIFAGFGRFHIALMILCGTIYMNTAVGITILSFVLPAAECDLGMTTPLKGWLNAAPLLGTSGLLQTEITYSNVYHS